MERFALSPRLQHRFERVVGLGDESLQKIVHSLENLREEDLPLLSFTGLETVLSKSQTDDNAYSVAVLLLNLLNMKSELELSSEEVVSKVHSSIAESPVANKGFLTDFEKVRKYFITMLDMRCLSVLEKAIGLTFDYKCLLKDARILTDIRPVFDKEKTGILAGIISHTMRLSFHQDGEEKTFSIAMDTDDVESLKGMCDEAVKKAKSSREFMNNAKGVKAIISGE